MPAAHSKYKLIYGRFIIVLAAFLAGYSFLHWWLVVSTIHDGPSLAVTHWILPAAIAILLYLVFLRKRFHLLVMETKPKAGKYHKRKGQRKFDKTDFSIVVIPLLAAPVIAAQFLLVDAAGGRQVLDKPADINRYAKVKYYELRHYEANLTQLHWTRFSKTHKRSTTHQLVIAIPLYAPGPQPAVDTGKPATAIWHCRLYRYITSDADTPQQQDTLVRHFVAATVEHIMLNNIDPFAYLCRPDNDQEAEYFVAALKEIGVKGLPSQHILTPVYEPFPARYTWSLHATWISTVASCLIILLVIVFATDDRQAWQQFEADKAYRKRNRITKQ